MCGLLGMAIGQNLDPQAKAAVPYLVDQLMYHNNSRGGDSFAVSLISPAGYHTFKALGEFNHFSGRRDRWRVMRATLLDWLQGPEPQPWIWVMGHNRKATHGTVNIRNQHPFEIFARGEDAKGTDKHQWILGAHNGVFGRHDDLAELWGFEKSEVDSETILKAILARGETEAVAACATHSSMALSYCLDSTMELSLVRGDRPLAVLASPNLVTWSSDYRHLEAPFVGLPVDDITSLKYILKGPAGYSNRYKNDPPGTRIVKIKPNADFTLDVDISDEIKDNFVLKYESRYSSRHSDWGYNQTGWGGGQNQGKTTIYERGSWRSCVTCHQPTPMVNTIGPHCTFCAAWIHYDASQIDLLGPGTLPEEQDVIDITRGSR